MLFLSSVHNLIEKFHCKFKIFLFVLLTCFLLTIYFSSQLMNVLFILFIYFLMFTILRILSLCVCLLNHFLLNVLHTIYVIHLECKFFKRQSLYTSRHVNSKTAFLWQFTCFQELEEQHYQDKIHLEHLHDKKVRTYSTEYFFHMMEVTVLRWVDFCANHLHDPL